MAGHLYELLLDRARRLPGADAIGGQEGLSWKTLSSRDLLTLVDRLAAELAEAGVQAGDRVVYWVPNHWRTPIYFFATWKLGAIVVPFDREMNPEGGARILAGVRPRLVVAGYGERPPWAQGREIVEWWEPGARTTPHASPNGAAAWARPAEDVAAIMFTSGTTGAPKGCTITHANLCSQADGVYDRVPIGPGCRLASILPLSHLMELATLVYAVGAGAATHYVPSRRAPDIVRVLQDQRITHMIVVPQFLALMGRSLEEQLTGAVPGPVLQVMLAAADRLPLAARRALFRPVHQRLGGQLRLLLVGGAPLAPETQRLWERLGVRVVTGYGTSECSPVVTLGEPDGSTPLGSVGRPIRGVEVTLAPDGEMLVRGPNVMRGYWNDPARTAEVLRDGWYATGDVATADAAGNLRLVGRKRDLIVLPSGLNVWPDDVEEVLRADPLVRDAAVVAVPTERGGAVLHAYLLPRAGAGPEPIRTIVAAANARLARHQRLATASWWEEPDFPRTPLLKLKRHLLPLPAADGVTAVPSVIAADDPVGQAIAGVARTAVVQPAQTLSELGLDSLGLVELAVTLEEKTGKLVDEATLHLDMTAEQVRAAVAAAPDADGADPASRRACGGIGVAPPLWVYTWGRVFRALGWPIDGLLRYAGRPIVILGVEHLDDPAPRVILAGTHRSFPDMPLVRYALTRSARHQRLAWRLIAANVRSPTFRGLGAWYVVLALGAHPIEQHGEREASLRRLLQVARASGGTILIFPQGQHTPAARERAGDPAVRFRTGVAHLAEALDAAVIPFGIAGTERIIPPTAEERRGRAIAGIPLVIRRAPIAIAFGPPLWRERNEPAQAFTQRLQDACYALSRDAERAIGDLPDDRANGSLAPDQGVETGTGAEAASGPLQPVG